MDGVVTYLEFRRKHPATRCWQKFDHEQRANHASSHRLTQQQRSAFGEYYYLHPMVPNNAFPTAKAATTAAFRIYEASNDKEALAVAVLAPKVVVVETRAPRFEPHRLRFRAPMVRVYDGAEEEAAELENAEEARRVAR